MGTRKEKETQKLFCSRLRQPRRNRPQLRVNLPGRAPQNQRANGVPRCPDILKAAQDVDPRVGQHDSSPRCVLDREFRFAVFTSQPADAPGKVLSSQSHLDVFDLEPFDVEVV